MVDVADHTVSTSDGGSIQTRLFVPRSFGASASQPSEVAVRSGGQCALVVHQYSVMGGSQELMRGIARCLALKHGAVAVTLNLRGVGASSGWATLTGHAEVADVVAVGRWLQTSGFSRVLLVCSSAGAAIGGSALDRVPAFTGYVALGYVFGFMASILFGGHFKAVLESTKPKLFVQGDRDEFTSPQQLLKWAVPQSKSSVTETVILPGVSHFALEGPEWDEKAAELSSAFAHRTGAWRPHPSGEPARETGA